MKRAFCTVPVLVLAFAAASCGSSSNGKGAGDVGANAANRAKSVLSGCQPHIEVQGSAYWAKDLGRPEEWVQQHFKIDLWEHTGADRGLRTGGLPVGSRAVILEETAQAYRVRSPIDGKEGWISSAFVVRRLNLNVATGEPC